jgi:hypothetical protein
MLVVARLRDGTKIKGRTTDFHSENDYFTVFTEPGSIPVRLAVEDMKAIFFVRSLDGNPSHADSREFPAVTGVRRRAWIEFKDGERMAGWPVGPSLGKRGFYIVPADSDSNVEKAWVVRRAVREVLEGEAAEEASQQFVERKSGADVKTCKDDWSVIPTID